MIGMALVAGTVFMNGSYYPTEAIRRGEQGRTRMRIEATADGRPDVCTIISSSGSPRLDEAACKLVDNRVRFKPVYDADGQPVRSVHMQGVTWRLTDQEEEEARDAPSVSTLLFGMLITGMLLYLPMSLLHALKTGDFWDIEKRGRLALIGPADRATNPAMFWVAVASRAVGIIVLSMSLGSIIDARAAPRPPSLVAQVGR